jgi:hypothetical protein
VVHVDLALRLATDLANAADETASARLNDTHLRGRLGLDLPLDSYRAFDTIDAGWTFLSLQSNRAIGAIDVGWPFRMFRPNLTLDIFDVCGPFDADGVLGTT